jgi:hypothetical protein
MGCRCIQRCLAHLRFFEKECGRSMARMTVVYLAASFVDSARSAIVVSDEVFNKNSLMFRAVYFFQAIYKSVFF